MLLRKYLSYQPNILEYLCLLFSRRH